MSILMDSCNVMRGSKNGFETKIRENLLSHLLDIDGDSYHHVHNIAKCFKKPFEKFLESLFSDVHIDFYYSSDSREVMASIYDVPSLKYTKPPNFAS